jgi:hypothetical protein
MPTASATREYPVTHTLATAAGKAWRRVNQRPLPLRLLRGDHFVDGEFKEAA